MEEAQGGRHCDVELERHQDLLLHLENHFLGEFVLTDGEVVAKLGRVDFLVLGGNHECRHSEQVQLALGDLDLAHVLVDDVHAHVEGLRHQSELAMHVDDPLDQESATCVLDISLHVLQVGGRHEVLFFLLLHVHIDILSELREALRVAHVQLVGEAHVLQGFLAPRALSLLEGRTDRPLRLYAIRFLR